MSPAARSFIAGSFLAFALVRPARAGDYFRVNTPSGTGTAKATWSSLPAACVI
jgi:hypothetical protein